jgi:hypothetical protein
MNSENGHSDYVMSIRFILNDSNKDYVDGDYLIEIVKNPANPDSFLWIIRNTVSFYSQIIEFCSQDLLIERYHRVVARLSISEPIYKACLMYLPGHPLLRLSINSLLRNSRDIEISMRDVMNRWYRVVPTHTLTKELESPTTEPIVSSLTGHIGEVYDEVYNNDEITELECKEDSTDNDMPPLIPFYSCSSCTRDKGTYTIHDDIDDEMPHLIPFYSSGSGSGSGNDTTYTTDDSMPNLEPETERILIEDSMGYFMPASHLYSGHKIDLENDKNVAAENVFENAVLDEIRSELDQELKSSETHKNVKIETGYKNYYIPAKNSLWSAFLPTKYDITSLMRESLEGSSSKRDESAKTFQIDPSYDHGC